MLKMTLYISTDVIKTRKLTRKWIGETFSEKFVLLKTISRATLI